MLFGLNVRASLKLWCPSPRPASEAAPAQVDPGAVVLLSRDGQDRIGFGYVEPTEQGYMRERWLLYRETKDDFAIVAAPLVELATPSLEAWWAFVGEQTREAEGYIYVKALSKVYTCGGDFPEHEIPWPLPDPQNPLDEGSVFGIRPDQIDSGGKLSQLDSVKGYVRALEWALATQDVETPRMKAEYWLLFGGFTPAGSFPGPITAVEPDDWIRSLSLSRYVEQMQSLWVGGAKLVITGCAEFRQGLPSTP